MSSSASGPNAIRLPVVVEIDQATNALKTLRRTADTETKGAATSMQANLGAAEKNVTASFASATRSATTFKEAVRGAGPAITGLSAALGQSAGPLGAFARSLLSIASNGFTPLGVAIGAATAAIGFFVSKSNETVRAAAEQTTAIEQLARSYGDLAREMTGAESAIGGAAKSRATTPTTRESLLAAQANLSGLLGPEEAELQRVLGQSGWEAQAARVGALKAALMDVNRQLVLMDANAARAQQSLFQNEFVGESVLSNQGPRRRGGQPMLRDVIASMYPSTLEGSGAGLPAPLPPSPANEEQRRAMAELMRGRDYMTDATRFRGFGGPAHISGDASGGEKPFSIGFTASVLPPTAAEKYAKGFGDAFTSGVTDAAMDLANSGDIGGLMRSLADQTQQAIYNGIISGFIEGTGLRSAAASIGQQLFSAGASAVGSAAGGGASANGPMVSDAFFAPKSARAGGGGDTIVIALVPDEAAADTMLSKASHRGAKAIAARMDGRGVAAGSIPTRRRG